MVAQMIPCVGIRGIALILPPWNAPGFCRLPNDRFMEIPEWTNHIIP